MSENKESEIEELLWDEIEEIEFESYDELIDYLEKEAKRKVIKNDKKENGDEKDE